MYPYTVLRLLQVTPAPSLAKLQVEQLHDFIRQIYPPQEWYLCNLLVRIPRLEKLFGFTWLIGVGAARKRATAMGPAVPLRLLLHASKL